MAVIGGGVAGVTAAWLLSPRHRVTLFERDHRVGGHTNTVVIPDGPDAGTPVDTGFIVLNDRNYPLFSGLLKQLGVAVRTADMSFGYHDRTSGLAYSTHDANHLFAQRRNLLCPWFLRLTADLLRFNATADLNARGSLRSYLERGRYSRFFTRHYLLPIGAALWSTPNLRMLEFPAASFLRFFHNHGMLSLKDRPVWQTVVGGSHSYMRALTRGLDIRTGRGVQGIARHERGATLRFDDGEPEEYEAVVVACHADQARRLLEEPSERERSLLDPWEYSENEAVLHTDTSLLPGARKARASWNSTRQGEDVFITYDMKLLQGLQTRHRYLVTLNRPEGHTEVIARFSYTHPRYTEASMATQNGFFGEGRTWFCGSYMGFGFHEDAVRSAYRVAEKL